MDIKGKTKGIGKITKQNQHIYSLDEVKELPESLVVVIIDGGIYNVTEFIDLHPGGRKFC